MFVSVCAGYDWCQRRRPGAVGVELHDLSCGGVDKDVISRDLPLVGEMKHIWRHMVFT